MTNTTPTQKQINKIMADIAANPKQIDDAPEVIKEIFVVGFLACPQMVLTCDNKSLNAIQMMMLASYKAGVEDAAKKAHDNMLSIAG